jgi:hypothetical protein
MQSEASWGIRCAGRKGTVFLVSAEDADWARQSRWYALSSGAGTAVVRYEPKPEGGVRSVRLSAALAARVWGGQNGKVLSHINGDPLDFRRENVHLAPRAAAPVPGRGISARQRGDRTVFAATATVRSALGARRLTRVFETRDEAEAWRAQQRAAGDPVSLALTQPPAPVLAGIAECAPPPVSSPWGLQFG